MSTTRVLKAVVQQSATLSRGSALVALMLSLLAIAMVMLSVAGEQVLAQHHLLALEQKRFARLVASDALFEQVAIGRQQIQSWHAPGLPSQGSGSLGTATLVPAGEGAERALFATSEPTQCPHPQKTESQCWRIQIQQQGTGFVRERMLIIPNTSCAAGYWYAPESRIYSDDGESDLPPPVEEPPPKSPGLPKGVQ